MYSQPFLLMPVMGPTVRPRRLREPAKRYVISQSSAPRLEPTAPRNRHSPAAVTACQRALQKADMEKEPTVDLLTWLDVS
jgi:hypothetical protein